MKRARFWIIVGVVAIVAVSAWYVYTKKEAPKTTYRMGVVDRGDVVISISATGSLSADTTVQVGTQVSGTIQKLFADFNSEVKKGQLLAILDPTFLQAAADQQRANKDRAAATANDAQRNFNRAKDLFAKGLIAQVDLDAATTALETGQAGLRQAQAALHQAEVNLRYATITAPISGVVVSRNVDVGQTVAASLSAPTLFSIANDLRKMQVQASVDEADIGSVKVGQNVTFRVDAYPDDVFPGTVREIRLAPVVSSNVVTYTVVINVQNPDLKLLPGMTATVTIEVAKAEGVLRVPIQATKFVPADLPKDGSWRSGKQGDSTRWRGRNDSTKAAPGGA
ncbi:MAG: efflux RND transporter periplasmic adaptor subunit, partial [Candidatus Zixiibacteriota bacterium]